jgi:hypothetical protein
LPQIENERLKLIANKLEETLDLKDFDSEQILKILTYLGKDANFMKMLEALKAKIKKQSPGSKTEPENKDASLEDITENPTENQDPQDENTDPNITENPTESQDPQSENLKPDDPNTPQENQDASGENPNKNTVK